MYCLTNKIGKYIMSYGVVAAIVTIPAYADIYKVTQPDGQVVYTDVPPVNKSAQDIKIEFVADPYESSKLYNNQASNQSSVNESSFNNTPDLFAHSANDIPLNVIDSTLNQVDSNNANINYTVNIIEPSEERAYRKPVQEIDVIVEVSPRMQVGELVTISIDGQEVATGEKVSIPTEELSPGEHVLTVSVRRADGSTSGNDNQTFFVIQNTQAFQQKVRFEQQMREYHQLPWHQKLIMKLKGEKPVLNLENNASDAFR